MVFHKNDLRFTDEDIVISGISGRFPDCNSVLEFQHKLMHGTDLVKEDDSRWPIGYLGTYSGMGLITDLKKFDAAFFGAHPKLAERTDPIVRVLLKTSYEAIIDAGLNPNELRGSETGVIVGVSSNEAADWWSADPDRVNGYEFLGCTRTMYSNRISFVFDLKGPSYTLDSQSSTSLVGIQQGYYMLKNGMVDAVIVGAVNLILNPHFNIMFRKLNLLSPDGKCKVFDSTADGYARSEAGVALILQRQSNARRIYATIVGTSTNCDGYKEYGCQVSSMQSQIELYNEVYEKFNLNPLEVTYMEMHGYGTKEGDATEVNGVAEVFCKGRKIPLLIGCVKSNMGHAEPAGGLVALVKVLGIFESNIIPPNIHYNTPNPDILPLKNGQVRVVDKLTSWNGGLVAINSFGIGGTNSHLVLKPNMKQKLPMARVNIPRLLCVSGRTESSTISFINKVKCNYKDNEFCGLLNKIFSNSIPHYNYRLFSIIGNEPVEEHTSYTPAKRPVCFVFSGMGSQWPGMGKELLELDIFRYSIDKSANILKKQGLNLYDILSNKSKSIFEDVLNSFVGITSIQVALVDVLKALQIKPDFIVGHSIGELACAYADDTLTLEQTILATYWRGKCLQMSDIPPGSMAAVGVSSSDLAHRIPADVCIACHNSVDSITISGPPLSISEFTKLLQSEGIFAREVNSSGIAFHSKYIAAAGPKFKTTLEKIIEQPLLRSERWISTSVPEKYWNSAAAKYSSAAYHLNNLLSPVLFQEALQHIPDDCVVIEIAPHALLQSILKSALGSKCTHIGLAKRNQSTVTNLLTNIGRLYNAGLQPRIEMLYPTVEFPVSRTTPMIQSLVEWDHSEDWFLVSFLTKPAGVQGEIEKEIDVKTSRYKFFMDSIKDGICVFPVSGFLWLIWEAVAKFQYAAIDTVSLVIENLQILKNCTMARDCPLKFKINILEKCQECEIRENGTLVARARVKIPSNIEDEWSPVVKHIPSYTSYPPLRTADIYQDLYAKGYSYSGLFRGIILVDNNVESGRLAWNQNWITYMDTMLQLHLLSLHQQKHCAINHVQKIVIDPKKHFEKLVSIENKAGLPVNVYHKLNIIKSDGIELRGIKSDLVSIRTKYPTPDIETYSFVPHVTDKEMSYEIALSILVQLVCENSNQNEPLSITEIVTDASNSYFITDISRIINKEPYCEATFTTISKPLIELSSVNNMQNYQLIITTGVAKSQFFNHLVENLRIGGYLFTVEQSSSVPSDDEINNMGIKPILKMPTKKGIFLLFRKPCMWKTPMVVMIKTDSFNWVESVKMALCKHQIDQRETMLIFHGEEPTGVIGLLKCIRREPFGTGLRCLLTDTTIQPYKIVDLAYIDYFRKGLAFNVYKNGEWGSYRRLLIEADQTVEVENAFIGATEVGDFSSLQYIEQQIPRIKISEIPTCELCYVYYSAIYAQDIRCVAGTSPYIDSSNVFEQGSVLGHEYSGRDSKGNKIFGMVGGGALATTVLGIKSLIWSVPNNWTLLDAVTVPRVYCNAYYALLVRGELRKNESVYINAGASGMCVACIAVALSVEANVYIGYNNLSEKNYLTEIFPKLPENNFISLERCSFEYQLLKKTNGAGVDLIFDTLNSSKRDSFITALTTNGRLVEFEKSSLFNESLGTAATEKNITFHKISQVTLWKSDANKECREKIYQLLNCGIKSGVVKPIYPTNVYTDQQVQEAFRVAKSGKFLGKIVIKFRDEEPEKCVIPATKLVCAYPSAFMDPDKSYIVTGGLTYVGIQLINWLITRGARMFVVASPYQPVTGYQHLMMKRWKSIGITISISNIDTSTVSGAENLIQQAISLSPVYGIFHFSMVACETPIANATLNHFELIWKSKVETGKSLDIASRKLCPSLMYFVGLSHVASSYGINGFSNIGYACSALEMLFEKRRADDYPSTIIQYGIIDDCDENGKHPHRPNGFIPQKISSCFCMLPRILNLPYTVVCAAMIGNGCPEVNTADLLIQEICDILEIENTDDTRNLTLKELGIEPVTMEDVKRSLLPYNIVISDCDLLNITLNELHSTTCQC